MGPGSFGLKRPLLRPPSRLGAHPSFWSRVTWSKAGGVLSERTDRKYTISISALRLRLGIKRGEREIEKKKIKKTDKKTFRNGNLRKL